VNKPDNKLSPIFAVERNEERDCLIRIAIGGRKEFQTVHKSVFDRQ